MACPVQLEPAEFVHPTVYREGSHALRSGDRCLCGFSTHVPGQRFPSPRGGLRSHSLLSDGPGPLVLQQLGHRLASCVMRDFPLMKGGSHCSRVTKLQFPGISSENAWRKGAMAVGGRMGGKAHSRSFSNLACHLNSNDSSASFFL